MTLPSGEVYTVHAQHDGQVQYKHGDVEIKVDNRGRASLLEQALQAPLVGVVGTTGAMLTNSLERAVVK